MPAFRSLAWPWHGAMVVAVVVVLVLLDRWAVNAFMQQRLQPLKYRLEQLRWSGGASAARSVAGGQAVASVPAVLAGARRDTDALVREIGALADAQGVAIKTLAVTHKPSQSQSLGHVAVALSATGAYVGLKAWQDGVQARFPAMALQSVRLHAPTTGSASSVPAGGLEGQWVWVYPVRDDD